MSIAVACKDFGFSFPEADIIRHISFELEEGTYMSIIGTNGSGKSTLLKSLLRLHERGRSHGEAFICGKPLSQCSQKELASMIGYVPQAGGRIPPFTVMEFLKLSRYPYRRRHEALGLFPVVRHKQHRFVNMRHRGGKNLQIRLCNGNGKAKNKAHRKNKGELSCAGDGCAYFVAYGRHGKLGAQ